MQRAASDNTKTVSSHQPEVSVKKRTKKKKKKRNKEEEKKSPVNYIVSFSSPLCAFEFRGQFGFGNRRGTEEYFSTLELL